MRWSTVSKQSWAGGWGRKEIKRESDDVDALLVGYRDPGCNEMQGEIMHVEGLSIPHCGPMLRRG